MQGPPSADDLDAALPDFDGRYLAVTPLAQRSLTRSFAARDPRTDQPVFLKLLRAASRDDARAWRIFANEPAILRLIAERAPAIPVAPVLEQGQYRGLPYFAQPLLRGWSVDQALRARGALPGAFILAVIEGCLELLALLDGVGVAHGDVSPDNLFVETDAALSADPLPARFRVRLVDFNSARRVAAAENLASDFVFLKLPYAAPELARGATLSAQTDLYALGATWYELLAGAPPHDPPTLWDAPSLAARGAPPLPASCAVPEPVEDLVRALLAPDPSARPASAAACLRAVRAWKSLQRWLGQTAAPPAWPRPASRPAPPARSVIAPVGPPSAARAAPPTTSTPVTDVGAVLPSPPPPPPPFPAMAAPAATSAPITVQAVPAPPVGAATPDERAAVSAVHDVPVPRAGEAISLVDFSVFAPATVAPATSFVLEVWAYLKQQRDEALERASRQGRLMERGSRGALRVPSGAELTLLLRLDGFEVPEPQDSFFWDGEIANVPFIVTVPPERAPGIYPGQLRILHAGLPLARLVFDLQVGAAPEGAVSLRVRREQFRSAFASYASADRDEVLRRVQGLGAAGIDVFLDVLSLRSGQDWERQLVDNIRARDLFYLFWSVAASKSEWVEREWRYALRDKGLDCIHPIPLVDPREAPPPPELASKHFNDLILACLRSESLAGRAG